MKEARDTVGGSAVARCRPTAVRRTSGEVNATLRPVGRRPRTDSLRPDVHVEVSAAVVEGDLLARLDLTGRVNPDPDLVRLQTFRCSDGIERVFEWHVKISLNAWRIYFLPLLETRQMIVGYVGPHPKNSSNPT